MKKWFSGNKKYVILSLLLTLLPSVIGCLFWNRLPESLVTHFGVNMVPDGYSSKAFTVFGLPVILTLLNLVCFVATAADPKQRDQNPKAMRIVFWILPLISYVLFYTVYAAAAGKTIDITVIMPLLFGTLFLIIGNYLPKTKQNSTLGIKIFWTLTNEENWNKTHRIAGKLWVAGGIIILLSALSPIKWMLGICLAVFVIMIAVPIFYSYRIYKNHKAQGVLYPPLATSKGQKWLIVLLSVLTVAFIAIIMFTGNITYTFTEDTLQIDAAFSGELALSFEAIDEMELHETFDKGTRVIGLGSARLSTGTFQNAELNQYTLYAYNACSKMILIRSGNNYLAINAETAEETQTLYNTLLQKTEN